MRTPMPFTCPSCTRMIYNRRLKTCEFCGKAIPPHLLLTDEQIAELGKLDREESKRHRARMKDFEDRRYGGDLPTLG